MDALKPGGVRIPRAFADHRTAAGYAYRVYITGLLARLGSLPPDASPTLREAGRLAVELEAMGRELDAARGRPTSARGDSKLDQRARRDVARLRRQMVSMRGQLLAMERRLEELATGNGHGDLALKFARRVSA